MSGSGSSCSQFCSSSVVPIVETRLFVDFHKVRELVGLWRDESGDGEVESNRAVQVLLHLAACVPQVLVLELCLLLILRLAIFLELRLAYLD